MMLRRNLLFVVFLLLLSAISGWLIHKMSLLGRIGISLIHKEYGFLKNPITAGGAVFGVLLLLFILQLVAVRRLQRSRANLINAVAMLLAIGGLYVTYNDFHSDITHRLLKERFHLGFYLFWIGWMCISMYMFVTRDAQQAQPSEPEIKSVE